MQRNSLTILLRSKRRSNGSKGLICYFESRFSMQLLHWRTIRPTSYVAPRSPTSAACWPALRHPGAEVQQQARILSCSTVR